MNQNIIKQLREPFAFKDVEWKIQVTTQDKVRGMAVAYIDSRAIQNRLDEAIGVFNWKNTFALWQDNSQICGLSIYDSERGDWVTKYDGAENTDIEPVKGGLSDSFKRAACVWGIGRYLYELAGIWVEIEQRGKGSVIKDNQYTKLETEYNRAVARMFCDTASQEKTMPITQEKPFTTPDNVTPISQGVENQQSASNVMDFEYRVQAAKPSGKESQLLELVKTDGQVITAYIRSSDNAIKIGSMLKDVDIVQKQSSYGQYNLINGYQIAA